MHAAAPESVFLFLHQRLGVRMEFFASPLNCYFRRFCSAFPDTDRFFGSMGSVFDFFPRTGELVVGACVVQFCAHPASVCVCDRFV